MSSHVPLPKERHSKSKLFATVSSLSSRKKEHTKYIETHPFNHRLTLIVNKDTEEEAHRLLATQMGHYYTVSMKLTDLIDPAFVQSYVVGKKGLVALSQGTRIDADDVIAIDGTSRLVMSLCKDTYQTLGLSGKQSMFPLERGARFLVAVDLATLTDPEKKNFRRIHTRLNAVFGSRPFTFAMCLYDRTTGRALNLDLPGSTAHQIQVGAKTVLDVSVPDLAAMFAQNNRIDEEAPGIFEWIGLAAAGATALSCGGHSEICTYNAPTPVIAHRRDLAVLSVHGMLSPKAISLIAQQLATMHQGSSDPFFLCVWGHEDAPLSWDTAEHGFLTSGEHMYAQTYLPLQDKCVTFQACCPWDAYS
ncbi:hypothetical protein EV175_002011 [Coemansia sp. RSA 1933]|nr:hypothetical protein EV175_002011 [Coemansia sp. RSA 1933]